MKDKHTQVFKGIDRFFDAYPLGSAREYLLSAIKAAESDKIWQAKAPLDLLYFFEQLQLLVIGVYEVRTEFDKSKTALHPNLLKNLILQPDLITVVIILIKVLGTISQEI